MSALNELALVAMQASRNLDEPPAGQGVRQADVSGTDLEGWVGNVVFKFIFTFFLKKNVS